MRITHRNLPALAVLTGLGMTVLSLMATARSAHGLAQLPQPEATQPLAPVQPQHPASVMPQQTTLWPAEPNAVGQTSVVVGASACKNGYPFGVPMEKTRGYQGEYQQVYTSSALSALGSGPVTITSVAFKPTMAATGHFAFTYTLSYTTATPNSLSTDYAANVEAPFKSYTGEGVFKARNDGSFQFVLPTSFLYDPTQGNLLLDVNVTEHSGALMPFAAGYSDDTNRVFNYSGDGNSKIGQTKSPLSYGLLTKFTAMPADSTAETGPMSAPSQRGG